MSVLPAYGAPPPDHPPPDQPGLAVPQGPVNRPRGSSPATSQPPIRAMSDADIELVAAIEAEAHPLDAWSAAAFREAVRAPRTYVCRMAGDPDAGVVGYAVVSVASDQADLQNLTVRADWRRRGLGRRLLADVLAETARRGAREIFLEVRHDNVAAIELYTSYGFSVVGRRRDYYARGVDGILMRLHLVAGEPRGHP